MSTRLLAIRTPFLIAVVAGPLLLALQSCGGKDGDTSGRSATGSGTGAGGESSVGSSSGATGGSGGSASGSGGTAETGSGGSASGSGGSAGAGGSSSANNVPAPCTADGPGSGPSKTWSGAFDGSSFSEAGVQFQAIQYCFSMTQTTSVSFQIDPTDEGGYFETHSGVYTAFGPVRWQAEISACQGRFNASPNSPCRADSNDLVL